MVNYSPRGGKITPVLSYAKWERIARNIEKYEQTATATCNIYLAFIQRFLQITARVRKADRETRVAFMKQERESREKKIKERDLKADEKLEKL